MIVCACVLAVALNNAAIALITAACVAAFMVAGVTIILRDGGFRPLRTLDLVEFSADDGLRAWEQQQAMRR